MENIVFFFLTSATKEAMHCRETTIEIYQFKRENDGYQMQA